MTSIGLSRIELRLLTYRPAEMAAWWSALLGEPPEPITARTTAVTDARLRVVIERSQIALDYHHEASGVTAINLAFDDEEQVRQTIKRLAELDSRPYRATRHGTLAALWFRDPNGTDVGVYLPSDVAHCGAELGVWPEEIDPGAVLAESKPPLE